MGQDAAAIAEPFLCRELRRKQNGRVNRPGCNRHGVLSADQQLRATFRVSHIFVNSTTTGRGALQRVCETRGGAYAVQNAKGRQCAARKNARSPNRRHGLKSKRESRFANEFAGLIGEFAGALVLERECGTST